MSITESATEHDDRFPELVGAMLATSGIGKTPVVPTNSGHPRRNFLEAVAAACAVMAQADGRIVCAERNKFIWVTRTHGDLDRFSHEEISRELLVQELCFAIDFEIAYDLALASIRTLAPHRNDSLFLIDACRAMILADGIAEEAEFEALQTIKTLLGIELDPRHETAGAWFHGQNANRCSMPASVRRSKAPTGKPLSVETLNHLPTRGASALLDLNSGDDVYLLSASHHPSA